MISPRGRLLRTRTRLGLLAALGGCVGLLLVVSQLPAGALDIAPATVPDPATPVTANATYFDALGAPYGGCGLPQSELDSQDFVALNVYDTPGDYTFYPRPIPADQADKMGIWNNGHNCGRWVQVSIGDYCTGTNDGAQNQPFCRNGSWVADAYNDATLTMLVADSCGDSNAWCRDDPYHLDLAKDSLNRFVKSGTAVGDMYPNHWNNRHIAWQFVPAPNYTGDIRIGFLQSAQRWWPAISVSHLANGIHGVEYLADGVWQQATMNGDMGQSYIIGGTTSGGTSFQIRVRDVNDSLINSGRVYSFSLPTSCETSCSGAYTPVTYTTGTSPTPTATATATATATGSVTPTASVTPTVAPTSTGCTATQAVTSSWSTGYQAEFTVRNTGSSAITGWTVGFAFPGSQQVTNYWNAVVTQSGQQVSAVNAAWNGSVAAGGSTTFGLVVTGAAQTPTSLTCTAH